MIENLSRIGNFTSSKIAALMSNGKAKGSFGSPFYTYVEEKNMERKLGRSISTEITARATAWGKLLEEVAFGLLPEGYTLTSKDTIVHPTIPYFAGSPDGENEKTDTVIDVKCPNSLKSFCTFAECESIDEVREKHKDGDTYYWQIVSNAILTGRKFEELIVYMPYHRELEVIREVASNYDGPNQKQFEWIALYAEDTQLPYLIEGKHYKHMYIFRWEISQADKDALTERVLEAGKLLVQVEPDKVVYKPTVEQIELAKAKIALMKELKKRLSGNYSNVQ